MLLRMKALLMGVVLALTLVAMNGASKAEAEPKLGDPSSLSADKFPSQLLPNEIGGVDPVKVDGVSGSSSPSTGSNTTNTTTTDTATDTANINGVSQYSALYWKWVLETPHPQNPLFGSYEDNFLEDHSYDDSDKKCDGDLLDSPEGTFSLAMAVTPDVRHEVERTCYVPHDRKLLIPLQTVVCPASVGRGSTEEELRQCAASELEKYLQGASGYATVDQQDLMPFVTRQQSPLFTASPSKDNILRFPALQSQAVADGMYIWLNALQPGKHTIKFGGSFPKPGYAYDVTYHLTVE